MIHHYKSTQFCHQYLYEEEMKSGCRLGLYSWADSIFSGKLDYVDEFVEVNSFNITGFTYTLVSIDNLPIYHFLYSFHKDGGTVVLI